MRIFPLPGLLAAVACIAATLTCSSLNVADGGSSTNTGNARITGLVQTREGRPAPGVHVRLRKSTYVQQSPAVSPASSVGRHDAITGANGSFSIDSVDTGAYCIESIDFKGSAALVACTVTPAVKEARAPLTTLTPVAAVTGSVAFSGDTAARRPAVYVQIYGLERIAKADSFGRFRFNDLPQGTYSLRIVSSIAAYAARDSSGIAAVSGLETALDTITMFTFANEDYATWPHSRVITVNTSAAGAAVPDTLTGFPLLLRIGPADIPFAQCGSPVRGTDLRFASASGSHLPYQIVSWDQASGVAEVWVRLDTVFGNSADQRFSAYWGKCGAADWSNGAVVFTQQDQFAGVWHMGQSLDDATSNQNQGTPVGTRSMDGVIGGSRFFDGVRDYIRIDGNSSLDMAGKSLTISLWLRNDGTDAPRERIFFEHDVWPNPGNYEFSNRGDSLIDFDFPGADDWLIAKCPALSDKNWHLMAAVFDDARDSIYLFTDGKLIKGGSCVTRIGSSREPSYIGARAGTSLFFKGVIDEVEVSNIPRSAAWLKLAYETQRPGQTAVRFAP